MINPKISIKTISLDFNKKIHHIKHQTNYINLIKQSKNDLLENVSFTIYLFLTQRNEKFNQILTHPNLILTLIKNSNTIQKNKFYTSIFTKSEATVQDLSRLRKRESQSLEDLDSNDCSG